MENLKIKTLFDSLRSRPVIAAVRTQDALEAAVKSPAAAIFLVGGNIFTLSDMVRRAHDAQKQVFLHLDLAEGIGRDDAGVTWCVNTLGIDGVISTRPALLKRASDLGAITIQRLFLVDSSSFEHGKRMLNNTPPDMAEVLPGIAPKAIHQLCVALDKPVIAGGLLSEAHEVALALQAGALAVSTGNRDLWGITL